MAELERRLAELAADRTSGAMALAEATFDLGEQWLLAGRDPIQLQRELEKAHPALLAVHNAARAVASGDLARVRELRQRLPQQLERIVERAAQNLPRRASWITLSASSTVLAALRRLEPLRAIALQSLPGGEGERFAVELEAALTDAEVRCEPDAAMGRLIPAVHAALVGVDGYDAQRNLVHKVGTLPLALCCRRFGKPFYAVGHSLKRSDALLSEPPDPLFDLTPGDLVTAILDDV